MGRTPRELGDALGADEMEELKVYESIYGIPDGYFMTGMICALLANLLGSGKGRAKEPRDFIPFFREGSRQTTRDHAAFFRGMAAKGKEQ